MEYAVGSLVLLFLGALVTGALTGRVRLNNCCAVSDPRRDLRMRDAFQDEA